RRILRGGDLLPRRARAAGALRRPEALLLLSGGHRARRRRDAGRVAPLRAQARRPPRRRAELSPARRSAAARSVAGARPRSIRPGGARPPDGLFRALGAQPPFVASARRPTPGALAARLALPAQEVAGEPRQLGRVDEE